MRNSSMSCSARFLAPFLAVLAEYPGLEDEIALARAQPSEPRLAVESLRELVTRWVCATRDPDLGLRAGQMTCIGTAGPLDYALCTAYTLGASLELAQRNASLYSEALDIAVGVEHGRVSIQFRSEVRLPRALTDLLLAMWYRNHLAPHLGADAALECSFSYPLPFSIGVHRSVFGEIKLNFGAAFDGFSFDASLLHRELASADPALHDVHCEYLELVESPSAQQQTLASRVRRVLAAELQRGRPSSSAIARRMRMSRRTLVRRLAAESTSFSVLLDDLRRQLGVPLVLSAKVPLAEIAMSLGFVHVQAFHRCFRRWTGSTPGRYRLEQQWSQLSTRRLAL